MRILQITDSHVTGAPNVPVHGTDTFRSLQAVLTAAAELREPPELVVVTGDISEDGTPASYERVRELLVEVGLPVYVLPGNHDSVNGIRRFLAGGNIHFTRRVDLDRWRLVFLDSTVRGQPHGFLVDSELDLVVEAAETQPHRPVAVCLHHGPTRPCSSEACRLLNDDAFIALLNAHPGVRVVLAGHAHLELERHAQFACLLTTPACSAQCRHLQAYQLDEPDGFWASHQLDASYHGFRIVTLHDDGQFDTRVHWVVAGAHR